MYQSTKIFSKIYYRLLALIIFLILTILKLFRKKELFLSEISNTRIGHFLIESELHLLEKKFLFKKKKIHYYYFIPFYNSCNLFLESVVKRNFKIIPPLLGYYLNRINNFFFLKTKIEVIKNYKFYTNDKFLLLNKYNTQLNFTNEEIVHGEKILDKMGLKNKKFVCLMNRDEEYLKINFSKDYSHHSYRNSNIKNYLEAANFLADQNIFVLRMGKSTDQKIEKKCDYIFDYANSNFKSDFLDLYLAYRCFFWVSGDVGLQLAAKVYRRPIVTVNRAPFFQNNWSGISKKKNITIFKKYYDKIDNKYLSISEIKKKNVGYFQNTLDYEKSSIYLEENSPDEIFLATKQMYEILNNKFEKKEQYKIIEKKFWKLYGIDNYNDEMVSDICYEFFNKNEYLLN